MAREKKKGKWKGKAAVGAGIAALALVLGLGGNGGLGSGGLGTDGVEKSVGTEQQSASSSQETPAPTAEEQPGYQKRLIEVSENNIMVEREPVAEEDLREALLRLHEQDDVWELRNDRAIKHNYDVAKEALESLSIPFF